MGPNGVAGWRGKLVPLHRIWLPRVHFTPTAGYVMYTMTPSQSRLIAPPFPRPTQSPSTGIHTQDFPFPARKAASPWKAGPTPPSRLQRCIPVHPMAELDPPRPHLLFDCAAGITQLPVRAPTGCTKEILERAVCARAPPGISSIDPIFYCGNWAGRFWRCVPMMTGLVASSTRGQPSSITFTSAAKSVFVLFLD